LLSGIIVGKRYQYPTSYRDRECPYCGLYFSPRGLNGHIRFKHPRKNRRVTSENPLILDWQEEVLTLQGRIDTEEGLKEALRFFLSDYLANAKPPKWMSDK
jgi:hypothetical protein